MKGIETLKNIDLLNWQEECIMQMIEELEEQQKEAAKDTGTAIETKNYKMFIEQTTRARFIRESLTKCRLSLAYTRQQIQQEKDHIQYWES